MVILKEILKIIDILALASMIYYIIIGICIFKKNKKIEDSKNFKKFACIIPARNEEMVIENLIKSLNNQEYPKELYDVFVLINNCTDNTEIVAKKSKAKIIDCINIKTKSKGDVLRYGFDVLKDYNYDAYIIFDADNVVHPKFIKKMNNIINKGYKLAQGCRESKNPSDTWISSSYSLHYMIQNCFVNKARMNINQSSFINGTGFMISKELLDEKGYAYKTMTEDIELTVKCALEKEKIAFAEEAITYDEQPLSFKESWKQRKRWSVGTIQCLKAYSKQLINDIIKNRNFSALDSILFLMAPFMQLITTFTFILHILINFIETTEIDFVAKIFFSVLWYLSSIIVSILLIKINNKDIKTYVKGIVLLPLFYFSWIPINIVACFEKNLKWEPIKHTKVVSFDNIFNLKYLNNGVKHEQG